MEVASRQECTAGGGLRRAKPSKRRHLRVNSRLLCANLLRMEQRHTLHIIDSSSRTRAELSRLGFDLGHHCEVYGSLAELLERSPASGIVLTGDGEMANSASAAAVTALTRLGCWLPVIALHAAPCARAHCGCDPGGRPRLPRHAAGPGGSARQAFSASAKRSRPMARPGDARSRQGGGWPTCPRASARCSTG